MDMHTDIYILVIQRLKRYLVIVSWARGYKPFFMLISDEHAFFLPINVKMPTIVGILTFMNRKNSILCLPEPEKG